MADLTITVANVASGTGAQTSDGTAGGSITQGDAVYQDATDSNKWKRADANLSAAASTAIGIALNAAEAGQPVRIQVGGEMNVGATLAVGTIYVLSATAGKIAPSTDLTTGWYTFVIGIGKSASNMYLVMKTAGVAVP
jgi:hypothetical protein